MERGKRICILFAVVGLLTVLAAAKSLSESLSISLKEKRVQDLNFSGLSLQFYLRISNSSTSPAFLSGYDYRLLVNTKEYLSLKTSLEETMEIPAREETLIVIPLKITYDLLFQALEGIENEDKAQCYLSGGLKFSGRRKKETRIPFAFSAEFPLLKELEIEFLALQINDLTIGGADLLFKLRFKNRNGFELLVDRLLYEVSLEDVSIGKGQIWGDKNIEKKGERDFFLPLLINFFEVGKKVSDILHQPSCLVQLSGTAEVTTVWGRLKIPIKKRERITVSRNP